MAKEVFLVAVRSKRSDKNSPMQRARKPIAEAITSPLLKNKKREYFDKSKTRMDTPKDRISKASIARTMMTVLFVLIFCFKILYSVSIIPNS